MAEDPELPPWARARPRRPESRPTWVVVLTMAMLLFGGRQVFMGLAGLTNNPPAQVLTDEMSPEAKARGAAFNGAMARLYQEHAGAVRVEGAAQLVLGALLCFAVAAVFSSDPRARPAAMAAAGIGLVFEVADTLFLSLNLGPMLVPLVRHAAGAEAPSDRVVLLAADLMMVVYAVPAVGLCAVLLAFFGGRRGRTFFGVDADARSA
jgi:hypothetical protein